MADFDVIIIGGGPAGLTAGLYCGRAGLKTLLLEGGAYGGQMTLTGEIENYPAFPGGVRGQELGELMRSQAQDCGAELRREKAKTIDLANKTVVTRKGEYSAKNIILAMGASPRPLGAKGENEYRGAGVSYCAVCDGGFFKGRTVAVIGGGDTAVHDCEYLSRICEKVFLIHRRDRLRGGDAALKRVTKPNVELLWNTNVAGFVGENGALTGLVLSDGSTLPVAAAFVAVGTSPNTGLVEGQLELDGGYIPTNEKMETEIPGVYAVGDIRKKPLRQVVTAASDGAVAASSIGD